MRKVLIDINIYIDAFRGNQRAVSILQQNEVILLSTVVIAELLSGFKRGNREHENGAAIAARDIHFKKMPGIILVS